MTKTTLSLGLNEIAGLVRATPEILRSELNGLGPELWGWHPTPDEWCVNEVIGHLIEADRNGFAGRIQTILAEDYPKLSGWDMNKVAAERRDCERNALDMIEELMVMRERSARMILGLRPVLLARSGLHPLVGELRVIDLIHEWVYHDRNHLKQVMNNVQAFVWPHMGNAQRFSQIM